MTSKTRRLDLSKLTKEELFSKLEILFAKVDTLTARVAELEEENSLLKIKKTSSNSSLAPSSDLFTTKPNQSLRVKSELKRGGQAGHKGHNLEIISNPDFIEKHTADFCNSCGLSLEHLDEFVSEKRQVVDIPPIIPICT